MTFYPDLAETAYITEGSHIHAIGWLDNKNSFNTGNVSENFTYKLHKIIEKSAYSEAALGWALDLEFGSHTCELCNKVDGSGIFGIPSGKVLYVAPTMILHYIKTHGYLLPRQFIDSVMASPIPGTKDYGDATDEFFELHQQYIERQNQNYRKQVSRAVNKKSSPILDRIHAEKKK